MVDETGEIAEATKISYAYGNNTWRDLLTSYNGQAITYDAQGNPLTYLGHTLEWEKGRQLKKFDNIEYTYNANGIRTSKKVNGVLHTYTLDGTKILRETWDGNSLVPLYDNEDGVCGILYNNVPYYFIKNLQGDVIAIVDKDAQTVARYSYDAWGVCSVAQDSVGIATINPFRYRGYYFDEEIELYYLQSRYYDASVGRFVNGDEVVFATILADCALANNTFTYAYNNPILNFDSNGYSTTVAYTVSSALYAKMVAMSAAATSLMASIKAFVTMIWNIFVVVGLLLIVIAAIVYICKKISTIYDTVVNSVKTGQNDYKNKYKNKICVYVLARKKKNVNSIFYVGRTNNTVARYNKHKKTKGSFYMFVVYTCTSLAQSRVVEQCVLAGCLTGKFTSIIFGQSPSNKINGISKKNAKSAVSKLGQETKDTLSLLGCTAESDWLLLMGY